MEMRERKSGLVVPEEKREGKSWRDFLFVAHYFDDVRQFEKLVAENSEARLVAILWAPFLNNWGERVGSKYLVVYQATEEIEMEVVT